MRSILTFVLFGAVLAAQADSDSVGVLPDDPPDAKWVTAQKVPERYAPRKWQESTNGIACTLTASKDSFDLGEVIRLQVYFKNISNHPFRFIGGMKVRGDNHFPLVIQGPAGKLQFKGQDSLLYAVTPTTLKPGEVLRYECHVNPTAWRISQKGRYSISLEFPFGSVPSNDDVPGWEGTIQRCDIEVTVR